MKTKQLVLHLWMYRQSIRKKIMGAKKTEESNITRERLIRTRISILNRRFFIVRNECLLETTPAVLCFCFVEVHFFPFRFVLSRLKRVHLKRDCNTIAFPRSSSLHTVNATGSVISLASAGLFKLRPPLWRRDMFILRKLALDFSREALLFKWINRVCRFVGFPWNMVRTFTDRYGTKFCRWIPLF